MPQTSYHAHPNPQQDRFSQYGGAALLAIMLLSLPLQALLGLLLPGGLMCVAALLTLLLTTPLLKLLSATPAVTLTDEGLHIHPRIWRERFVPWGQVQAVLEYPLLPTEGQEVGRRTLVGRRKYRPAEGIMLLIPSLPPQYRVTGYLAGQRLTPVIALTNRTHTDYERLVQRVRQYTQTAA